MIEREQIKMRTLSKALTVVSLLLVPQISHAQQDKADKTGTNPINFTYDFRLYNEYLKLNTPGDGTQNVSTMEFRAPILKGKWQFRTRARYTSLNLDTNDDGVDEVNTDGLGEVDFRFLTVPYLDMPNRRAIAVGFETFLPTAKEGLGSQRLSFGPQIFGVFFAPFGIKNSLIAPAYQHKFSVYASSNGRNLHQGLFDIFFLKTSADKQLWALVNPQMVLDYREDKQFGLLEVEVGTMLDKWFGSQGKSIFMRPSLQVGRDRPAEASIEVGFKAIW
jgi:hypothetical protein